MSTSAGQGRYDQQRDDRKEARWSLTTRSPEQTFALGAAIGAAASPGLVICLFGDLGSGKTRLTQGIAEGLSVPGAYVVTSPTFTYVNEYPGRLPLYHIDLYRISSADELSDLGWEEYLESDGVVVIEWAERAGGWLPGLRIEISIAITGADGRRFDVIGCGDFPALYETLTAYGQKR